MAKSGAWSRVLSSLGVSRIVLGMFFVVLGVSGIIPQAGEGIFGLSRDRTALEILFGVVELACGAFLLFDAFRPVPRKASLAVLAVILVLWLLRIFLVQFVQGMDFRSGGVVFRPSFWSWILTLATDLVVASGLWTLYKSE